MNILSVLNLCKKYEGFELKDISFELGEGYIMGFIGRNGAGKTTTLKAMLNLIKKDSGSVFMLGKNFDENEFEIKQGISFMLSDSYYYQSKRVKNITACVKKFYPSFDEKQYKEYISLFNIDESKKLSALSAGMKVKYSLALAMSHGAKLLILDEPTSGLDIVSRDEITSIFQRLVEKGVSIIFSTHIVSDLEKCADYITYIKNGEMVASMEKDEFISSFRLVCGKRDFLSPPNCEKLIGIEENAFGFTALVKKDAKEESALEYAPANLENIILHIEKEENNEKFAL